MAMLYPVDASPLQTFSPLSSEPPTSFTQDLSPDAPADCLLLECGDVRNILWTLFYDEDKGKPATRDCSDKTGSLGPRSFDITCTDREPAFIGLCLLFARKLTIQRAIS
jgi:hypothetical protein